MYCAKPLCYVASVAGGKKGVTGDFAVQGEIWHADHRSAESAQPWFAACSMIEMQSAQVQTSAQWSSHEHWGSRLILSE